MNLKLVDPKQLIAEALDCDINSIALDSKLGDHPEWNSIGHLQIMLSLQQNYQIEITDKTIQKFQTFDQINSLFECLSK